MSNNNVFQKHGVHQLPKVWVVIEKYDDRQWGKVTVEQCPGPDEIRVNINTPVERRYLLEDGRLLYEDRISSFQILAGYVYRP